MIRGWLAKWSVTAFEKIDDVVHQQVTLLLLTIDPNFQGNIQASSEDVKRQSG